MLIIKRKEKRKKTKKKRKKKTESTNNNVAGYSDDALRFRPPLLFLFKKNGSTVDREGKDTVTTSTVQ